MKADEHRTKRNLELVEGKKVNIFVKNVSLFNQNFSTSSRGFALVYTAFHLQVNSLNKL